MRGFLLYEGPSALDGEPIVCVATAPWQARLNAKTNRVVQTYVLRADVDPLEAIAGGSDSSICGSCVHRGVGRDRSCYVQIWQAPRNIWLAYQRGKYERGTVADFEACGDEVIRMGAYGDPAAVPFGVWGTLFAYGAAPLGYTHQWRTCDQRFALYCMASVETAAERRQASALGWRTFRVRVPRETLGAGEIACPAAAESGKRTTCSECRACGGHTAKARCDVSIVAHGTWRVVNAFARKRRRRDLMGTILGQRRGRLVCIEIKTSATAVLRCDCGAIIERRVADFERGNIKSCASDACRVKVDLAGKRFGRLLVDKVAEGETVGRETLWWCVCDCGAYVRIRGQALVDGNTKSCGCLRRERSTELAGVLARDGDGHWANATIEPIAEAAPIDPEMSIFPPSNEAAKSDVDGRSPKTPSQVNSVPGADAVAPPGIDDLAAYELAPVFLGVFDPPAGAGAACLALCNNQCRWPIGDAGDATFRFCCAPADPRSEPRYCGEHRKKRDRQVGEKSAGGRKAIEMAHPPSDPARP